MTAQYLGEKVVRSVAVEVFSASAGGSEDGEAGRVGFVDLTGGACHPDKSFPSMFSSSRISSSYRDKISSGKSPRCSRQSDELSVSLYKLARTKRRSGRICF